MVLICKSVLFLALNMSTENCVGNESDSNLDCMCKLCTSRGCVKAPKEVIRNFIERANKANPKDYNAILGFSDGLHVETPQSALRAIGHMTLELFRLSHEDFDEFDEEAYRSEFNDSDSTNISKK